MTHLPSLGPRGEGWVAAQVLVGAALVTAAGRGPAWRGPARFATSIAGTALLGAGAWLGLRGALDLRGSLSPFPKPRASSVLVEDGVYAQVRHPIYGGQLLMALGLALASASLAALVLLAPAAWFFDLKSRREEALLGERFAGYEAYRRRTHRFVPGLW